MSAVQAVLFDLGNVLVDVDQGIFPQSLGFQNAEEIMYLAQDLRDWARRYETGQFATDIFLAGLQNILGGSYPIRQLRQAFQSIIRDPIPGMEDLVADVSRLMRTALASNTNEIHHLTSMAVVPALAHLSKHYVSYELKVMKPEPEFYAAILRDLDLPPAQVVFIDDKVENIAGATAAGMSGVLFTTAPELRERLRALGVA